MVTEDLARSAVFARPRRIPEAAVSPSAAPRWGRTAHRRGALALFAYALISLAADFPIWPGDPHQLPTMYGEDIIQTTWFLEWTPYALLHGHNLFSTNLINYPNGVDLAQNTGMPLLGLLTAPLTLAVSPVASMNLLRWLAFTLSAYAAYWVVRHWTRWAPAAFVAGLVYGFSPYMVTQGSVHLNLIFVPLPPLIMYALFELVVAQRSSPVRMGALLGVACMLQFYISSEILATTALVCAIALFFIFFLGFRYVGSHLRGALVGIAVASAILLPLIAYPTYLMFHGPQHYVGPAQGYNNVYNADLLGPLIPTSAQLVAPQHLANVGSSLVGNQLQENGSYLGIPLLVIVTYLVCRYWRRLWPLYLSLLALTVFALSLGPTLIVHGKPHILPINLPFRKIDHFPGIANILPVRFSLYVVFFVAIVLALGIDAYRDDVLARRRAAAHVRTRRHAGRAGRLAGAVLAVAAVIAFLPRWPYKTIPLRVNYSETAKGLKIVPTGATVLAYPYPTAFSDFAMLWQALDGMRFNLLGSYALIPGKHGGASTFPATLAPRSVEAMFVNSITPVPDPDLPNLTATPKTITPTMVNALRQFIRQNGVTAVVIGLGDRDCTEIELWMRLAIGPPTRAGGGAEIWTHVRGRLRTTAA